MEHQDSSYDPSKRGWPSFNAQISLGNILTILIIAGGIYTRGSEWLTQSAVDRATNKANVTNVEKLETKVTNVDIKVDTIRDLIEKQIDVDNIHWEELDHRVTRIEDEISTRPDSNSRRR
jgi:hypothetical protein